jgi:hypothetical protein
MVIYLGMVLGVEQPTAEKQVAEPDMDTVQASELLSDAKTGVATVSVQDTG